MVLQLGTIRVKQVLFGTVILLCIVHGGNCVNLILHSSLSTAFTSNKDLVSLISY